MNYFRFTLINKKTKQIISPDEIMFYSHGHFVFDAWDENGKKIGTDEEFDITVKSDDIKI